MDKLKWTNYMGKIIRGGPMLRQREKEKDNAQASNQPYIHAYLFSATERETERGEERDRKRESSRDQEEYGITCKPR